MIRVVNGSSRCTTSAGLMNETEVSERGGVTAKQVSPKAVDAVSGAEVQCEEQDGPDHVPPVDDRPDLRVVRAAVRVRLRDRDLADPIAQRDELPVEVVLELIPVEPALVSADARVVEQREAVRAEAVRHVGAVESTQEPEDQGETADEQTARQWEPHRAAAFREARTLHVVVTRVDLRE